MSDAGQQGDGQQGAGDAGAGAGAAPAFDWSKQGLDADSTTYVQAKGWKTPVDLLKSYQGAEKLLSVPADQVIKLPQNNPDPKVWNEQVYDRLGRPKEAAGYELTKLVPEGHDTKFAEAASGKFHELGLNTKQAHELTKWWNESLTSTTKAADDAKAAKHSQEVSTLKAEWGANFETNAALVDKAAEQFGMKADQINALKETMGPAAAMKFLHNIGSKLGVSDQFISGDTRQADFAGGLNQDQAKAQVTTWKADKAFMAKYLAGDAESKQRMQSLMAKAYPGVLTV